MKQIYIFIIFLICIQPEQSVRPKFRQSFIQSKINSKLEEPVENKIERLAREAASMPPLPPNPNATKYPVIQDGTTQQYNIKKSIKFNPDADNILYCYIFRQKSDDDYMPDPVRVKTDIVKDGYIINSLSGEKLATIKWDDLIYQIGKIDQPLPDFLRSMASNDRESQFYFPFYDQAKKFIKKFDLNVSHFILTSEEKILDEESSSSDDETFRFQQMTPEEINKNAEETRRQKEIMNKNIKKALQESSSSEEDELQIFTKKNKQRQLISEFGIPLSTRRHKRKRDFLKENRQYILLFTSDYGLDQYMTQQFRKAYFQNRLKYIDNIKMPMLPPVMQQYCKSYNTDHKKFEEGIMLIEKENMNIQRTSDGALLNGFWWNLIKDCSFQHVQSLEDVEIAEGYSSASIDPKSCATFVVQWSSQVSKRQYLCFDKLELIGQEFWVEVLGAHLKKTCYEAVGKHDLSIDEQIEKMEKKQEEKLKDDKNKLKKLEDINQSQIGKPINNDSNKSKNDALKELESMENEVDDEQILKGGQANQEINILKQKIANDQHDQITLQEALEQPELINDFVWRRLFEQRKDDKIDTSDLLRKVLKLLYNLDKKYQQKENFDNYDFSALDFINKSIPEPEVELTKWEEQLLELIMHYADQQKINGANLLTENERTLIITQDEYNKLGYKFDAENTNRLLNLNVQVQKDVASLTPKEHEQLRILNGLLMDAGDLAKDERYKLEWETEELRKLERRMDGESSSDYDFDASDGDLNKNQIGDLNKKYSGDSSDDDSSDDDSSDFDGKKKYGADLASDSDDDEHSKKKNDDGKNCEPIIFKFDDLGLALNIDQPGYLIKQNDDSDKTLSITSDSDRMKVVNVANEKIQEMICNGIEYFDQEWKKLLSEKNYGPRTDSKTNSSSSSSGSDSDNDDLDKNDTKKNNGDEEQSDDLESKLRQDLEDNISKLKQNTNSNGDGDNDADNNSKLNLKDAVDSEDPVKASDKLAKEQEKLDNKNDNNDKNDKNDNGKNDNDNKKSDDKDKNDKNGNNDKDKLDNDKSENDDKNKKNSRDMEKDVMKDASKNELDAKNKRGDSQNSPNQSNKDTNGSKDDGNKDKQNGNDKNSSGDKDKPQSPEKSSKPNGNPGELIAKVPSKEPLSDHPEIAKSLQPNESLVTPGLNHPDRDGVAGTGPKAPNPELDRALQSINDTNDADM